MNYFAEDLKSIICIKNCESDNNLEQKYIVLIVASSQDELRIAKFVIDSEAHAIISEDSDFAAGVGYNNNNYNRMIKYLIIDRKIQSVIS